MYGSDDGPTRGCVLSTEVMTVSLNFGGSGTLLKAKVSPSRDSRDFPFFEPLRELGAESERDANVATRVRLVLGEGLLCVRVGDALDGL